MALGWPEPRQECYVAGSNGQHKVDKGHAEIVDEAVVRLAAGIGSVFLEFKENQFHFSPESVESVPNAS